MGIISKHISDHEAWGSKTAEARKIDNKPDKSQTAKMKHIAENVFEPLREHFGKPIGISSFFRSKELNEAIGGSESSQHCKGEAIDIDGDIFGEVTNREIFIWIRDNVDYDQLIWEFGDDENPNWVHVSLKFDNNRKQMLRGKKKLVNGGYIINYEKI
jgi:hypothetical protein